MKDENKIKEVINKLTKMTGREVSKEKEQKIIEAIVNDKVQNNIDKMLDK